MNSPLATVNKILKYSCVDGPGNRLVIFLQGCNFNCPSCHNPYTIGICDYCGDCIPACEAGALSVEDGKMVWDSDACDNCDVCLDVCPVSASPMTREYNVEQILEIARDNSAFLSGITVSGGEATLQLKFVIALFEAVKADPELSGLTCFVDSNGNLGDKSWEKLLPVTDGVMLDIKAFDYALHRSLTGHANEKPIRSVATVHAAGKLHELRFLVIPERTNTVAELENLLRLMTELGQDIRIKLNAFQHHGVRGAALNWPKATQDDIQAVETYLRAAGIDNIVTPAVYL